jgi:branched-chain amino acid transport system permease protein
MPSSPQAEKPIQTVFDSSSPSDLDGRVPRLPYLLPAGVRNILWRRRTIEFAALVFGFFLPFLLSDAYSLRILTVSCLLAACGVGLITSLGYTGIFNMSQGTFYGIGAYATAILVTKYHASFEIAILFATLFTTTIGAILSLTALRIRGDYWSLVSMAFTVGVERVLENWIPVTQGLDGYVGIPILSLFGQTLNTPSSYYYASFGLLIFVFIATRALLRSFAGRAMLATRFDESGARAMGVSVYFYKILSLAWSAAMASLAGSMLVAVAGYIFPTDFDLLPSFNITLFVIVGGITSPWGALIATTFLFSVTEIYRPLTDYRFLILGGSLLIAIFLRGGVFDRFLNPPRAMAMRLLTRLWMRPVSQS